MAKGISKSTQSIVIGGVFFLIPLLLIIVLVQKALSILFPFVKRLANFFDIHSVFGAATITLISLGILILLAYLSGLLIKKGLIHDWNSRIEDKLFLLFPSLQMIKYRLLPDGSEDRKDVWKPILLKDDMYYNLVFITKEHENGLLSLFVPDAPRMDAGEIRLVDKQNIDYQEITMKQAMNILNSFGKIADIQIY